MKTLCSTLFVLAALGGALPAVAGQAPAPRTSPHETINAIVSGTYRSGQRVVIVYGRPYTKSPVTRSGGGGEVRKIWGGLVPYGAVWRTGADEATVLMTTAPLTFGSVTIPPGAYSLYTLPLEDGSAKLIFNKQVGQWGLTYDEKLDVARVDLKKDTLEAPVDQFTMAIERTPGADAGTIKMMWENAQYSVPFTVVTPPAAAGTSPAAPAAR